MQQFCPTKGSGLQFCELKGKSNGGGAVGGRILHLCLAGSEGGDEMKGEGKEGKSEMKGRSN